MLIASVLLLILAGFGSLQSFLHYSRIPQKPVDCIILLYGPEFDMRLREVTRLTQAQLSKMIFHPLTNRIKTIDSGSNNAKMNSGAITNVSYWKLRKRSDLKYFENTHLELAIAEAFVRANGMRRIAIVSSPFHMRRVKLIADRLFNSEVERYYLSPDNHSSNHGWILNWSKVEWIFKETVKICWFLFYWHFLPVAELSF